MPSQIAATPIVKGSEAKKILEEANTKRSPAAEKGARKLAEMFSKKFNPYDRISD